MKISPGNGIRSREQRQNVVAAVAPHPRHGQIATITFLFVAFFLLVCWAGKSFGQAGQKYDVANLRASLQDPANVKKLEATRKAMISRTNVDKNSQPWKIFELFYSGYIFPKMTQPDARGELSEIVDGILKDVERAQRANSTAASEIGGWIIKGAGTVASGNYHPAARINATLLLANLDEKLANISAGTPPTPDARALGPLYSLWNTDTNPDGVRAAALQGVRRHIAFRSQSFSDKIKQQLRDQMEPFLAADPPTGRSPAAHGFMQRYVVDILYILNDANTAQQFTDSLVKLSSDPQAHPIISLYAAEMLAKLGKELQPVSDPTLVATSWSTKAADFFDAQSKQLEALTKPKPVPDQPHPVDPTLKPGRMANGYAMGGYSGGGYGGGEMGTAGYGSESYGSDSGGYAASGYGYGESGEMGYGAGGYGGLGRLSNPQPVEVIAARRKLNHALQAMRLGLTGSATTEPPRNPAGILQATQDAADQADLEQLVDAIATAFESVNDPQYDTREKFTEMVTKEAANLRKLGERLGAGGANPTPEPAPDAEDTEEAAPGPDVALARP